MIVLMKTYPQSTCDATRRAMATLSERAPGILRLVFYEEQPYEEISTLLGIPTNTVKARVYSSRAAT